MSNEKGRPSIGSSLDDFLTEQGIADECNDEATKRILNYQLEQAKNNPSFTTSMLIRKSDLEE